MEKLLDSITSIAKDAGEEILSVYNDSRPIDVTVKDDHSPLTIADRRANAVIVDQLQSLDDTIPLLSEELDQPEFTIRSQWPRYWLIDPLDGTKEFINRNGEFTVNIALIDEGKPVLGVVHVPVSGVTYLGGSMVNGAWQENPGESKQAITVSRGLEQSDTLRIVASRSHRGALIDRLIEQLKTRFNNIEVVSMGSSLKICLLAEGKADLYPRLAPTSEWDTAAAHAVLFAAGGDVLTDQFVQLDYNQKADILNPHFLAISDRQFDWVTLLQPGMP